MPVNQVPNAVDLLLAYKLVKRITTPFNEWEAYKLGIIDGKGNILKKKVSLSNPKQRSSWTNLDIVAANLKKVISKHPGVEAKIAARAAQGLMVKEDIDSILHSIDEEIANVVGNGQVAGLGVGQQGEPGKNGLKKKRILRRSLNVDPKLSS
jgi:hypothetical protein